MLSPSALAKAQAERRAINARKEAEARQRKAEASLALKIRIGEVQQAEFVPLVAEKCAHCNGRGFNLVRTQS